jgi:hypothetical protein
LQEELLIFEGLQRGGFDKWVLFCITWCTYLFKLDS